MATKKKSRAKQKAAAVEGEPNIKFIGRMKLRNGETVEMSDAPQEFNSGQDTARLPATVEEQRAGFYLPAREARRLVAEHRNLYKLITNLGAGGGASSKAKPTQAQKTAKAVTSKKTAKAAADVRAVKTTDEEN